MQTVALWSGIFSRLAKISFLILCLALPQAVSGESVATKSSEFRFVGMESGAGIRVRREQENGRVMYYEESGDVTAGTRSCDRDGVSSVDKNRYLVCVALDGIPLAIPVNPPRIGDIWEVSGMKFVVLRLIPDVVLLGQPVGDVFVIDIRRKSLDSKDETLTTQRHALAFSYTHGLLAVESVDFGLGRTGGFIVASDLPSIGALGEEGSAVAK